MAFYLLGIYEDANEVSVLDTSDGSIEFVNIDKLPLYITKVDISGVIITMSRAYSTVIDVVNKGQSAYLRSEGANNYMIALNRWNSYVRDYKDIQEARTNASTFSQYYKFTLDLGFSLQTLASQGINVNVLVDKSNNMWLEKENKNARDSVDCFAGWLRNRTNK